MVTNGPISLSIVSASTYETFLRYARTVSKWVSPTPVSRVPSTLPSSLHARTSHNQLKYIRIRTYQGILPSSTQELIVISKVGNISLAGFL